MKISYSEFQKFKADKRDNALRFGQAWYNYFSMQKHTPANADERALLDRIYNEPDSAVAQRLIVVNFIDYTN